jgi:hypothetical protein
MTRKKENLEKEKNIIETIEEALVKTRDNLRDFVRGKKPEDRKPEDTVIPDDFSDFDEAYDRQDKWELGEGSDWEDMNEEDEKDKAIEDEKDKAIEDAIIDDLAMMDDLKLRF